MRSPARAIAWEFRQRHRWGLIAVAVYLATLVTIRLVIFAPGQRVDFEDVRIFALVVVVPLTATFLYFLAVFSFGLAGDLAARQSMYPPRMFTLPVTSAALAGWPMLYGTVAMVLLWLSTRLLGVWPAGEDIPMYWPALLAASMLAWTQTLTWMPYPLPGLRVIVTVVWLTLVDAVVMVALEFKASEPVMLAILAPHVPLAYLFARFAVDRARRGHVPDWGYLFGRRGRTAVQRDFRTPARAQMWFEWRQHGRSLPAMVAIVVPCELSLLFVFPDTPVIVFEILILVLLTPPFMARFVAATISKPSSGAGDAYGVTAFLATRPMTSASLIAAKLRVTIRSTLASWLLVVIAVPLALRLSGAWPIVAGWFQTGIGAVGMARAITLVLLGLAMLMASTWKQLVQSLCIGLTGREWVVKASVFLALALLTVGLPLVVWVLENRKAIGALWNAIPWILAVMACVKVSAACWIAMRLHDHRLLSDRTLVIGALAWDVAVFALYGLLVWLLPALLFRSWFLALVAILAIPLARLSAAPLALAWNRHR